MRAAALGKVGETASARILADVDGLGSDDTSYLSATITPGYTFDDAFRLRAEYRLDSASEDVLNGEGTQHTVAVAADYQF